MAAIAVPVVFFLAVASGVWRAASAYCFHHEDLGIYAEALARLSWSSPNPFLTGRGLHVFNDHFDPMLFAAVPLRWLTPAWMAGLVAEHAFVLAACVPLWWLARERGANASTTFVATALLLASPAVTGAIRFPVHPTTWAIAPMMLVVALVTLRRYAYLPVALVALFACKEEFPFFGLVLAALLFRQRERLAAAGVFAVSAGWLLLAFAVRPWLVGPTSSYGASLFSGLAEHPLDYVVARLTTKGIAWGLWDFVAPMVPVALWMAFRRVRPDLTLLLAAAPLLAIRFLGMAWRHHYLAPLVPIIVGVFVVVAVTHVVPRYVTAASLVILVALNGAAVRFALARWGAPVAAAPHFCPATTTRLSAIDQAMRALRAEPGAVLVEGNLFAQLAERDDVSAFGSFRTVPASYRFVLFEKPPHGDPYPQQRAEVGALIDRARSEASRIIVDDADIFFAEGTFHF